MTQQVTIMEKYIVPFLITVFTALAPVKYWFGLTGFFILLDFGLRSMIILRNNPHSWVSSKIWRTVAKLGAALLVILAAFVSEKFIAPSIPVMQIAGSFLILAELKSIDEKVKEIYGISLFNIVIEKLTSKK